MQSFSALIDFSDPSDPRRRHRHAFGQPRQVLQAQAMSEVVPVLRAVEHEARAGRWCVGGVRYEAAAAFDPAFQTHAARGPLVWFAVYDQAEPWPDDTARPAATSLEWASSLTRSAFEAQIHRIHDAIRAGEVYQINLTAPLTSRFQGDAQALFHALQRAQPGGYAAYVDMDGEQVLSVSPELFFDWCDGKLLGRPMKGTAARLPDPVADARQADHLRTSDKERAENLMIVDLIRNDMSRVAEPHSVRVPRLFHTEALPTVWQMTSDVHARTRPGVGLADIFSALFPCGSVTGAPKIQALRLIHELEASDRGWYCGALGVVRPGGHVTFNVPIRTVSLRGDEARCGIGSGITIDSTPEGEWGEWRSKRAFLERARAPFELLETLRLQDGQLVHRQAHLDRMAQAARHFGFAWPQARLDACLVGLAQAHPTGTWRVRLLLAADGTVRAEAFALDPHPVPMVVRLATAPMDDLHAEFVRYKTTRRGHYEAFAPAEPGVHDTLLWNESGEITEFTRGNVALHIDGRWVTPPASCGLLAGVGRQLALAEGRVVEQVVHLSDLPRVDEIAFINSLRGWIPARRVD
jgi:para-aminobenzoate synthetase/4-amino-4-deoxychorismate lyase